MKINTIRNLLTDIVNEQGKLNIGQVSNLINRETNSITSVVNVKFEPKDPSTGIVVLPFALCFDEDDPTVFIVYSHCIDSSNGTVVTDVVYAPDEDKLSSPDDLPDIIKSKYRPSFLPKLFENYQYIVEIAKKLETHKGTM